MNEPEIRESDKMLAIAIGDEMRSALEGNRTKSLFIVIANHLQAEREAAEGLRAALEWMQRTLTASEEITASKNADKVL